MQLLDGKSLAQQIKEEIKQEVDKRIAAGFKRPHLAAILVGSDGASETYVGHKVKSCQQVGFESTLLRFPDTTSEQEVLDAVNDLNSNSEIDGFIVQLPLPKHINEERILMAIDPIKDVDGFHPSNFGKMALEMQAFIPATPFGIVELLKRYQIDIQGKECVVIGRSHIVGRPVSILLSQKGEVGNATVTLTHSRSKNIEQITRKADIIISALGIPEFLKEDMVKDGAIVIDVGITRVPDETHPKGYRIKGDVDFENVAPKTSFITPVPGGVGPMTIAMRTGRLKS